MFFEASMRPAFTKFQCGFVWDDRYGIRFRPNTRPPKAAFPKFWPVSNAKGKGEQGYEDFIK
jgi:hypothetical protein